MTGRWYVAAGQDVRPLVVVPRRRGAAVSTSSTNGVSQMLERLHRIGALS